MKLKYLIIFLIFCMLAVSCVNVKPYEEPANQDIEEKNNNENLENNESKVIVIYFSCTNKTLNIATKISEILSCDIERIIPFNPYTEDDLKYYTNCRADIEQSDDLARPKIANKIDVSKYDTIILGYPIWHGKAPKILYTFIESVNLTSKRIIPFCTSGSSSPGSSSIILANLTKQGNFDNCTRLSSSISDSELKLYLNSLNL